MINSFSGYMDIHDIILKSSEMDVDIEKAVSARFRYLNDKIVLLKDEIEILDSEIDSFGDDISNIIKKEEITQKKDSINRYRKWLENLKLEYNDYKSGNDIKKSGITVKEIQKAKEYPINLLIPFKKHRQTNCPFHDDKHPSATNYNNRLYCHSCAKGFDSIDIYKHLHNVDFIAAVKTLISLQK